MTSDDLRNVTFEPVKKGYRPEDVDDFLQQVAAEMDAMRAANTEASQGRTDLEQALAAAQQAAAEAEQAKEDAEGKMLVLAQRVEEYREQEDTIKTALLNAQRMGETVVKEAKQKAEQLVRDASNQADLLRQQADQEIESERYLLEKLRNEVTKFKSTVLTLYKQHIEAMSALDAPVAQADDTLAEFAAERGEAAPAEYEEMAEGVVYEEGQPEMAEGQPENAEYMDQQGEAAYTNGYVEAEMTYAEAPATEQPEPVSLFETPEMSQ